MDAVQELIVEVERVQCMVYLTRSQAGHPVPTGELMEALRLAPSRCGSVVDRLAREGLVRVEGTDEHPLQVELTGAGRAAVREWKASVKQGERG